MKDIVLIVEDDPIIRSNICEMLEMEGYKTLQAGNGEEAILIIQSKKINLIISDWMMPKMDGVNLLTNLKKSKVTRSIPFIILTAKSMVEDKINALELGADDFLVKPFSSKELFLRCKNKLALQKSKLSEDLLSGFSESEIQTKEELFLKDFKEFIALHYVNENLKLSQIAEHFIMGTSNLQKYVKKLTGKSVFEILFEQKLIKAQELLLQKTYPINEIASICGFKNTYYFTRKYKKHFGILPSKVRKINEQ
ncbi:MAG: response regulator [Bacteroidia bacterium]|nr:response regulator [Bacteroidia bacterium]MCF8428169.1 response regulator [Bacteroidia bacterium]MCF8445433.1 response regulator [Bacteroidia bacterium]